MKLLKRTVYDIWIALFLLSAIVGFATAFDRPTALSKLLLIVASIVLLYLIAFSPIAYQTTYLLVLSLLGALVGVYFLFGQSVDTMHPNIAGGTLAMLLPVAASAVWLHHRQMRLVTLGCLLLIVISLLMTQSRGALAAVLLTIIIWGIWYSFGRITPLKKYRPLLPYSIPLAALFALCIIWLNSESVTSLIAISNTATSRFTLARQALTLAYDYPFIGAGLGSFPDLHAAYALLTHVPFITHAHNLYLDISIEQGLLGVVALLGCWWTLLRSVASSKEITPIQASAVLSVLVMSAHGLIDDPIYSSRALPLLFVPLGFGVISAEAPAPALPRTKWPFLILIPLALVAVLYHKPLGAAIMGNVAAIEQSKLELSQYSWPDVVIQDVIRQEADLNPIKERYQLALQRHPDQVPALRRLGQIALSQNDYASARSYLQQAYRLRSWDGAIRQLYGEAALLTGDTQTAQMLWKSVSNSQDQLVLRRFWYEWNEDFATVRDIDVLLQER